MRKFHVSAALAAVLLSALVAGSALGAGTSARHRTVLPKKVAFAAAYAGTAAVKVTDNVADIQATGKGTGKPLGAGTITGVGKGDTSQQPCVPFTGPGTMVGAKGAKLAFTVLTGSTGCGDEGGNVFAISGKAKVVKGYGALKKAKGTLKFTGTYDRNAGTFTVKFKGTLTA